MERLRGRGVEFQDLSYGEMATEGGILELPDGTKAAWLTDTEGNVIGLSQVA